MNWLKSFKRTFPLCLKRLHVARWAWIIFFSFNLLGSIAQVGAQVVEYVEEPFRIMILRNTSQYLAAGILQDRGMREAFAAKGSRNVEFFVETMDTMWFDRSQIEPEFLSLFRKKYGSRKIDLLMAAGADALDFALRFRQLLLPGVPIVFYNVSEDALPRRLLQPSMAGVTLRFDLPGTLDLAMRLQPGARRIVVVSGTSPYDRNWLRRAREALKAYDGRLEVSYWSDQPLHQVLDNLRKLPADSIVLYLAFSDDGAGHTYSPADVAKRIAAASTVPVYGVLETYLGQGIVGGAFPGFEAHGKLAGEVALRVLEGEKPDNIGVQPSPQATANIDWRELQRRKISESRLPPGTVVRFRSPSMWEEYRWYIIGAFAIFAVQALSIIGLLLHRARRRRAERELWENQEFMELSISAGELGLWARDMEHDDLWTNPRLRSLFGFGPNDVLCLQDLIGRIHPHDRDRVIVEVERAQRTGVSFEGEFRVLLPEGGERWVAARGRAVDESGRHGMRKRRVGVMFDVTERKQAEQNLHAALVEIRRLKEQLEEENLYLKEEISEVKGFEEIVGQSDALKYVLTRVEQVAKTDATVLLQGETGVGKELFARAIHDRSSRSDGPYIKVNCATLPEALVESELFGHERGAFTGAERQRKGRFELADGGTILLDEAGELPAGTQAKLLRVLQEGEFERVGGSNTIKVRVRVIAATNRKLHDEVSAGRFRQDLFYRLNVYPITIPPLSQRREDIPLLVRHYARQLGERLGKTISEVPAQVMRAFTEYNWPGNIRELQNVIERAVIVSLDGVLRLPEPLIQATNATLSEVKTSNESSSISSLNEAEREHILRALEATGWRINGPNGAAAMLKLHPSTLRFRMKKLGLTKISGYTALQTQKSNLH
ncbi:MAG TPA: sigma 54-interacting transcriptional regulator [Candidatus Limnocylindrales bacterium]|nr:sigma 54-interacting transcriptional regulator [Candidatus Limnocylindrales bacterium]